MTLLTPANTRLDRSPLPGWSHSTAGSTERWRGVSVCASRSLELQLGGHGWGSLGYDGQALVEPLYRDTIGLAPGNRADLLLHTDLRGVTAEGQRTITFTVGMGMRMGRGMGSVFDGQQFDPARVDQHVATGAIEEWTIANTSPIDRRFHRSPSRSGHPRPHRITNHPLTRRESSCQRGTRCDRTLRTRCDTQRFTS